MKHVIETKAGDALVRHAMTQVLDEQPDGTVIAVPVDDVKGRTSVRVFVRRTNEAGVTSWFPPDADPDATFWAHTHTPSGALVDRFADVVIAWTPGEDA